VGLLLSALRAEEIDRLWRTLGAQQQRRRSPAPSSECGQCRVDSPVVEAEYRLFCDEPRTKLHKKLKAHTHAVSITIYVFL